MAELLIRPARREDIAPLVAIYGADTIGGHGERDDPAAISVYEAAFAAIAASTDTHLFVAERDGQVVGTFTLSVIPSLVGRGRPFAKIESVHVRPDCRSDGIGATMVARAEEMARQAGARHVELTSNKERVAAHRFYDRLGYARSHVAFKKPL